MGIVANLKPASGTPSFTEDAAPKQFVLIVQPEPLRRVRFMELYRKGLVAQWVQDVKEASKVMARVFDIVVVDLDYQPQEALSFCREMKQNHPNRMVVVLGPAAAGPGSGVDVALPRGASARDLVNVLGSLRSSNQGTPG